MMLNSLLVLAQTPVPTSAPAPRDNPLMVFVWMGLIVFVFWFLMLRPKQKEQKQRDQMLKAIKKYDKVMTIGGIVGTVMEVREEEIIIKVDENTNTRIKFTRGAIQRVLSSADADKTEKSS